MVRLPWLLWLTAALLLTGFLPTGVAQAPEQGPAGLHLAYGPDPATSMTVAWVGPPAQEAHVEVTGPDQGTTEVAASAEQPPGALRWSYHAELTELAPATAYTYQVVLDGQASQERTFTTAPAPGEGQAVRITHFADHGTVWPANTRADDQAPTDNVALSASMAPDVHLVSGDTSYAEGDPHQWDLYLEQIQPLAGTAPYMTVPGNHEREGTPATSGDVLGFTNYDARFRMPEPAEDGRWWQVQVGHTLVVGLNSETACAGDPGPALAPGPGVSCQTSNELDPEPRQLAFLEETLSAASQDPTVTWTVVALHHTLWSSASHGSIALLQEHWGSVFDEHGVDLVLQGHDHVYERSHPIQAQQSARNGTVYLTNGAGGSGHYDFVEDPAWSAARDDEHYGTLVLDLDEDTIEGRFVALDGQTVDTFTLHQHENGVAESPADPAPGSPSSAGQDTIPVAGPLHAVVAIVLAVAVVHRFRG